MIFKNFADQDWIGFNFADQDWTWTEKFVSPLISANNLSGVNSSGKCSLTFVDLIVWSSIPDCIKSSATFTFKWTLKKHLLHEKDKLLCILATFHLSRTDC